MGIGTFLRRLAFWTTRANDGLDLGVVILEWDRGKAATNLRKHRVAFEDASTVFLDPLAITFADPDHSMEENREITIGFTNEKASRPGLPLRARAADSYYQRTCCNGSRTKAV